MSASPVADRNLLFGILALQMDFITRDQLVAGMNAWVLDKAKPLSHILEEQRALATTDRKLLEPLVDEHLRRHGNDPQQSLAAISSVTSLRRDLAAIADSDVQASVRRLENFDTRAGTDPYGTRTPSYGDVSSDSRFFIVREHARGGLGQVYVARDRELDREVALKEILPHQADRPEARTRFLIEAEITGGLEHPGIVPVYGLGHHADGRPFYAMRFIKGDTLWQACERFHGKSSPRLGEPTQLSRATFDGVEFRWLLGRFIDVCNAIAYAHSRGVLHRDLKPGNIMLGRYGETLVVDWGLAKAGVRSRGTAAGKQEAEAGQQGASEAAAAPATDEQTLRPPSAGGNSDTIAGTAIGTPAYMSPEQAAGRLDLLSPASDIYSLGATLYVILTGRVAFSAADTGEVLRRVERGEFDPPHAIQPAVPRPLSAVCLKAMATKPAARYAEVADLVRDVERWLADEPVGAWPDPWWLTTRRWVGRHRMAVTSAAAVLAVSAGLLTVGNVLLTRANADLEKANQDTLAANELLRKSNEETRIANEKLAASEKESRALAVQERKAREAESQARALAMNALRKLTDDVVEQQLARRGVLTDDDRRFLRDIQRQYEEFASLSGEDTERRAVRAEGHLRVGLTRNRLGEQKEAEESYRRALALYRPLAAEFSMRSEFRLALGMTHHNLGILLNDAGRLDEASRAHDDAVAVQKQLAADFPAAVEFRQALASSYNGLGNAHRVAGDLKKAETAFAEALAIRKQLVADFPMRRELRQELAGSHANLAALLRAAVKLKEAQAAYADALAIYKELAIESPGRPEFRQELATIHNNLGVLHRDTGQQQESYAAYAEALAIQKQLAAEFPARPEFRHELAGCHSNLGALFFATGRVKEAETAHGEALALRKQLVADFPGRPEFRQQLAMCHNSLAILLQTTLRQKEAGLAYDEALAINKRLAADFPGHPEFRVELAGCHNNLGAFLHATGRAKEAETAFNDALAIQQKLVDIFPNRPEFRQGLAGCHNNLGVLLRVSGRLKEAEPALAKALAIRKQLVADFPLRPAFRHELAASHTSLASLWGTLGRLQDAECAFADALAIHESLVAQFPELPDYRNALGGVLLNLAILGNGRRDFARARGWLEKAQPHHVAALKSQPNQPAYRQGYQFHLAALAMSCAGLGEPSGAVQAATKLRNLGWDPPTDAFNAACALSLCIPIVEKDSKASKDELAQQVQFYGDQAMTMLRDAVARGWNNVAHTRKELNLAPLRQRRDFQKMLIDLDAKGK